jgi:HEPN domain-containing protein
LRQAEADLRDSRESEHFEWAAFASHQVAKKAIKALYQQLHLEAWGHALVKLFEYLPSESRPRSELMDRARELDKHYILTRYPNGFEPGAPVDYYTRRGKQTGQSKTRR